MPMYIKYIQTYNYRFERTSQTRNLRIWKRNEQRAEKYEIRANWTQEKNEKKKG